MRSGFLTSADVVKFHTPEAYTSLRPTDVQYNIKKLSVVEKK